jgi:hypothetical protein
MILAASRELGLDLARSWMVGDKDRDVDSGVAAGLDRARCLRIGPKQKFEDFAAAARHIERSLAPQVPPRVVAASTVALAAEDTALLGSVWPTIRAAGHAIAERTGVEMLSLDLIGDRLVATLATHRLAALGFAAELRRQTNRWSLARLGRTLWKDDPKHDDEPGDDSWDSSDWFEGGDIFGPDHDSGDNDDQGDDSEGGHDNT